MSARIAYFVNQYPRISHSFIRREILALERLGFDVQRIALRGWEGNLVDAVDRSERAKTRYVLREGLPALLWAVLRALATAPARFAGALALALRMGWRAERPLAYHLAYFAEACRILPWLREFGAIHLHAHFGTNSAEVAMLARALGGPPYSFTVHGPEEFDKPQFIGLGEKVRRAAFVIAISSFARSQVQRWVEHSHWPKIRVVHCGLEPEFHAQAAVPPPARRRMVCIGRLNEQKGQLLLVEAASRLASRGVEFEVVLIGEGEMREEIDALVERLGLQDRVRLTGAIGTDEMVEEILKARALVLPSFAEGLPMTIMEAMSLRRPVLTTSIAGIPELVQPGKHGWLIPAGSVEALVEAMEMVLDLPVDELEAMGEAAHARAVERHSVDVEAAKLASLFLESCPQLAKRT